MLVTVGIPFFNAERTLPDAVRSVFAQSFQEWELILLDDGSTDSSLDIARSICDPRVRVISDGLNRGVVYRHNQMASLSRGKYIAKLDDDDIMHPGRIHRQVMYMEARPSVDVLATSVYTISDAGVVTGLRHVRPHDLTHARVIARCVIVQPAVMGTTEWFRRNPYDPRYVRAEDHELWARTFSYSTVAAMPEPLTYYREGVGRTLRKYLLSMRSDRAIYRDYAMPKMGWGHTTKLVAATYVKASLFCTMRLCGLQDIIFQRSRDRLTDEERRSAQQILDSVLQTAVPGWLGRITNTFVRAAES